MKKTLPTALLWAALALSLTLAGAALAEPRHIKDCAACGELVVIPPGSFKMGFEGGEPERYDGPVHEVTISRPFAVGLLPVTVAQFRAFVDATHYRASTNCRAPANGKIDAVPGADWRTRAQDHPAADNEPVVCISWFDARAYADWLAKTTGKPYRLLTEAEYEYVARAGSTGAYAWGDDPAAACLYANLADASMDPAKMIGHERAACNDGYPELAPAGSFRANAFGVKDMNSNAWSWVEDCYVMPYPAKPADGSAVEVAGKCDRRAVRGASWATTPSRSRTSFRGRDLPDLVTAVFGVRVARDLTPAEQASQ